MNIERTPKQMAEAVLTPLDHQVNRNSKDSVFCNLFSDPKYVLELYAALHPEDDITDVKDITLVTLENQILRAQYNDLGFIIGNRLMILVEEQSAWSLNVLIRFLPYLGETYQRYIRNNKLDVYGAKKLEIPHPELYVVYPKDRKNLPDEISLSKDIFGITDPDHVFVDVRVKIIYDSKQGDILNQYIVFCRVFDEQIRLYGRTEKAVRETIRICRDQNVLKEYLAKEEVSNIMFGAFDKEYQLQLLREQEREEGREEEKLSSIRNLMETLKLTAQQAMDALKISDADRKRYLTML
ncbi:MAG: hypothetical protein IJI57_05340 [Flexilinea sp.]|nr:hypothetical protein [Flexilinea sp.]